MCLSESSPDIFQLLQDQHCLFTFMITATDDFSAITNFIVFYSSYKFKNKKRQIASFKVRFHLPSFPRCNFYQDEGYILHKYMK